MRVTIVTIITITDLKGKDGFPAPQLNATDNVAKVKVKVSQQIRVYAEKCD